MCGWFSYNCWLTYNIVDIADTAEVDVDIDVGNGVILVEAPEIQQLTSHTPQGHLYHSVILVSYSWGYISMGETEIA